MLAIVIDQVGLRGHGPILPDQPGSSLGARVGHLMFFNASQEHLFGLHLDVGIPRLKLRSQVHAETSLDGARIEADRGIGQHRAGRIMHQPFVQPTRPARGHHRRLAIAQRLEIRVDQIVQKPPLIELATRGLRQCRLRNARHQVRAIADIALGRAPHRTAHVAPDGPPESVVLQPLLQQRRKAGHAVGLRVHARRRQ